MTVSRDADNYMPPRRLFDGQPPSRDEYVLNQGFTRDLEYCRRQLPDARMWAPELDQLPATDNGRHRLTRRDLFAIAQRAATDPGDPWAAIQLHAAITFWGARPGRLTQRAVTPLNDPNAPQHLTEALRVVRGAGPESAYKAMDRYQRLWVRGLGSSYFTKFFYFGGYGAKPHMSQPLILDDNVLKALSSLTKQAWQETAADYTRYLDLVNDWAYGLNIEPDVVERRLFELGGWHGDQQD